MVLVGRRRYLYLHSLLGKSRQRELLAYCCLVIGPAPSRKLVLGRWLPLQFHVALHRSNRPAVVLRGPPLPFDQPEEGCVILA